MSNGALCCSLCVYVRNSCLILVSHISICRREEQGVKSWKNFFLASVCSVHAQLSFLEHCWISLHINEGKKKLVLEVIIVHYAGKLASPQIRRPPSLLSGLLTQSDELRAKAGLCHATVERSKALIQKLFRALRITVARKRVVAKLKDVRDEKRFGSERVSPGTAF